MIQDFGKYTQLQSEIAAKNARAIARNFESMMAVIATMSDHINLLGGKVFQLEERIKELEERQ